MAKTLVQIW